MQATLASGDHNPLWLQANKYGLSSLETANGFLRGALSRPLSADASRRWGVGYGADVALTAGFTSRIVVHQAYVEARWLKGVLTLGAKEQPMALKHPTLSTGSQTLGINARPVPQVRLALPDYWQIPGVDWLALKGHIAFGRTTDGSWQRDFSRQSHRYTTSTGYHSKAGYVRIGRRRISFEAGLEMAAQFGGTSYVLDENGHLQAVKNDGGLSSMLHAMFLGGTDPVDGNFHNVEGNQLGSWVARLNIDEPAWSLGLYADQFFEDNSMMFHFNKSGDKYVTYAFKDWLLGAELRLRRNAWLQTVVLEYLYSKYQGGPVYHDHTSNVPHQISGRDNYYNHHLFSGWQHWGLVMGNPLYLSPLYNADGAIEVRHNRLLAWHLGLEGAPLASLRYRLLATWQKGYGSYYYVPADPECSVSLLAELSYAFRRGWAVRLAAGLDVGALRGDNQGLQLSVVKSGLLTR